MVELRRNTVWRKIVVVILGIMIALDGLFVISDTDFMDSVYAEGVSEYSDDSDFVIKNGALTSVKKISKHISIPEGVISLGTEDVECHSLYGNGDILSVTMPDTVTFICNEFFRFCDKMTSLRLSKNLKKVDYAAFEGCRSLVTLSLPNGITDIPEYCCSDMDEIRYIKLPSNLKTIGKNAFSNDPKLEGIYIPSGVTFIDPTAFAGTRITLVVDKGSYAETYAKEQQVDFVYRQEFSLNYETKGTGTAKVYLGASEIESGTSVHTGDVIYVTASTKSDSIDIRSGVRSLLFDRNYSPAIKSLKKYPIVLTGTEKIKISFIKKAGSVTDALYVSGTKNKFTAQGEVANTVAFGRTTAQFQSPYATLSTKISLNKKSYILFDECKNHSGIKAYFKVDKKTYEIPNTGYRTFEQFAYEIPSGTHTLTWGFTTSDPSGKFYEDDAYLDNVRFSTNAKDIHVASLTSNVHLIDLRTNETGYFSYNLRPQVIANRALTWTSDDTNIATVESTKTGSVTVKGISRGRTVISASVDGISLRIPVYVSFYSRIGDYEYHDATLTWYFKNQQTKVTISKKAEIIDEHAFDGHSEIQEIIVPSTVKEIRGYAFYDCKNLKSVTIADSVESIGRNALPKNTGITIRCAEGTVAHEYAKAYGYKYVLSDGTTGQETVTPAGVVTKSRQILSHTDEISMYDNYMSEDPEYDYVRDGRSIYRYNIAQNRFDADPIFTADDYYFETASRKGVLYISQVKDSKTHITGYDVLKNKIVYTQVFDLENYDPFAVDDEQNFFFSTGKDLFIFNKEGEKIDEEIVSTNVLLSGFGHYWISQVDPFNRALFATFRDTMLRSLTYLDDYTFSLSEIFSTNYAELDYVGYKAYRNGKLTSNKYYIKTPQARGQSVWRFFQHGQYAVNATGQIVRYKTTKTNETGIDYEILYQLPDSSEWNDIVKACMKGDIIYTSNSQNRIFAYNVKTKKVIGTYDLGSSTIEALYLVDNEIYIRYSADGNHYIANLNTKAYTKAKTVVRKEHKTLKYTKAQVVNKYTATQKTDYTEKNSYKTKPSSKYPYKAGALSAGVKKQTLAALNYVRWQTGLNSVKLYDKYMNRSQKGAVVLAANQQLSHMPEQPPKMDDKFYQEGYAGVNADMTYSGNCSFGDSLPDSVIGYVSDARNQGSGIGHRNNLLDPTVDRTSFGYCENYSAMSMYYADDPKKLKNNESYYAWPSAGYFPTDILTVEDAWSLSTDYCSVTDPMITLSFKGKKYVIKGDDLHSNQDGVYFYLPEKLKKAMCTNSKYRFDGGITVNVAFTGILDDKGNDIKVTYPVKLINALPDKGSAEYKYRNLKEGYVSKDGKAVKLDSEILLLNRTYKDSKGSKYKITKFKTKNSKLVNGEVSFVAPPKTTIKKYAISGTVKINGKKFKVAAIGSKAFRKCTKLTQLTIGNTVKKIGASAFAGCTALKTVKISSTKLTVNTIGKNAFSRISKKATFKLPKSKLKVYKDILLKKGANKKMKFVKIK